MRKIIDNFGEDSQSRNHDPFCGLLIMKHVTTAIKCLVTKTVANVHGKNNEANFIGRLLVHEMDNFSSTF